MSDKIIFNGKVYGETVTAPIAIFVKEEEHVDPSGNYVYIIDDEQYTETIGFKQGGRIKYGAANTATVICQGLKMNMQLNDDTSSYDIVTNIENGLVLPSDLYSSFDLDISFPVQPTGIAPLMKKYEIVAPLATNTEIYECLKGNTIFGDSQIFYEYQKNVDFDNNDIDTTNNYMIIEKVVFTGITQVVAYKDNGEQVAIRNYDIIYTNTGANLGIYFEGSGGTDASVTKVVKVVTQGTANEISNKELFANNNNKTHKYDFGKSLCTINAFGNIINNTHTQWSDEYLKLLAYINPATVSRVGTTIPKNTNTTYSGIYFLVRDVTYGQTYGYSESTKDWTKTFDYGYTYTYPVHIHITELKNKLPSIYMNNIETMNFSSELKNLSSNDIYIIRKASGTTYDYYYKIQSADWKKKEANEIFPLILGNSRNIQILGTTEDNPLDGTHNNSINVKEENNVNMENFFRGFFKYEFDNSYIDFTDTSNLSLVLNGDKYLEISKPVYFTLANSNTTEVDDNNNLLVFVSYIYTYWRCLTETSSNGTLFEGGSPIPLPFKSEAERNFSLGIREDLRYITEEEYNEFHGGETNE